MILERFYPHQYIGQYWAVETTDKSASLDFIQSLEQTADPNYILYLENLRESLWEEKERPLSTPDQLSNLTRRALIGVRTLSKEDDPTLRDARMMTHLTDTFVSFTDLSKQTDFVNWFTKSSETNSEKSEYFLQTLLHYATLLDLESYAKITTSENGRISLLPLDTLTTCMDIVSKTHSGQTSDGLSIAYQLFDSQYKNLLDDVPIQYTEIESIDTFTKYAPDATELGFILLSVVEKQVTEGSITLEKGLRALLNYIQMHEAQDVDKFFKQLESRYGSHNSALISMRKRAIELNTLKTSTEETRQVEDEGIQQVANKKVVDARDLDYSQRIPEHTKVLLCGLWTGSFSPFHIGHLNSTEVWDEIVQEQMQLQQGFYGILHIAPIPSVDALAQVKTYTKSSAQVGDLRHRIWCMISSLRHLNTIELTTQMQPDYLPNPLDRILTTQYNIEEAISSSYNLPIDQLPFIMKPIRIVGVDKFIKQIDGVFMVREPEPALAEVDTLAMGRRGHLGGTLLNLLQIHENYTRASVVLGPWKPRDSSTLAIESGDFSSVPRVEALIMNGYFSKEQIKRRERDGSIDNERISVTQIDEELKILLTKGSNYLRSE
jgi:hypothetical protein